MGKIPGIKRSLNGLQTGVILIWIWSAVFFLFHAVLPFYAAATTEKQPPLKIGYCSYMPFYFMGQNQKPRGILVDLWEQWSHKTGIPVTFSLLPWQDVLEQTASGQIDVNALMYRSDDRDADFLFSNPLMNLSTYVYFSKNNRSEEIKKKYTGLKNLDDLTMGVVAKDYTRKYLARNLPGSNPIIYTDHESLVKAAISGEIEGFLMEGPVASTYIAKHNGGDRISKMDTPVYTKPLYAGVKAGQSDLIATVNQGLSRIAPEEIQQIYKDWTAAAKPFLFDLNQEKLKIAVSIDNMPFHFADENGAAVGYFIDLWRLWSKKTGIRVEFITAPWAESLTMVKEGRADIHAGCFFSVQRDTYLDYAGVLSNCETHFFFHESIFGLKNLEDLRGFQIGILDQDYAVEYVSRELPGAAIKKYSSHHALFKGVTHGEVRVFICDTPTALYFLKKENLLSAFRYHPAHPLYRKPFYSAVKEGNARLVETINNGLTFISPQERAMIERKWMGTLETNAQDVLIIAFAQGAEPFSMLNAQGQPSGLFVDMWRLWSQKTGKPVSFRIYDREAAVNALKDGIVDVVSFQPSHQSVSGWTQQSDVFYRLNWYFYHPKNLLDPSLNNPSMGSVIGSIKGSAGHEWLIKNRPGMRVVTFETTRQMILAAARGRLDTFLALPQEMAVIPDRLGLPGSFIQGRHPLLQQQVGAVVRNYNPDMIALIRQGFEAMEHSEKIDLEERWVKDPDARVFNHRSDQILLTKNETQWLARNHDLSPSIRLGIHPEWPPFEFIGANQQFKGMVSDYVGLLNQRLGLNMAMSDKIPLPMAALDPTVSGFDVIPSAVSYHPESGKMLRSLPYIDFPWVIINRQDAPLVGGIRDFYGKALAVVESYAIKEKIAADHPQIRIIPVRSVQQGMEAVLSGGADGYLENLAVAGYQIQAQTQTGLKVAASTDLPKTGLTFSVRKDWPELVSILNKGIASITDQEHDQIRQKWFSVRFEHQMDQAYARELFFKIGIGGLLVAGLFTVWNWQIRKRKEIAEAANLSKTKFLASLSHEIRTPLNAILGMTDMTLKTTVTPQQEKNLKTVKDSALHLLDVITDILDYSTLEAGRMRIQNKIFSLGELLSGMARTWTFLAEEKGLWFRLSIDAQVPPTIYTDPVRLQQILENLISNAVKFTHTGGIRVRVECADQSLVFLIEDTGIGIAEDQQDLIFERFTQAETSMTRNYGGTGLGLAICKEAARLMGGGTLDLYSRPGKGSRFYLRLPLDQVLKYEDEAIPETSASQRADDAQDPEKKPLTLLLVEDDRVNAEVFKSYFEGTRNQVLYAPEGRAALDILNQTTVDMVFMDIEMPGMDGMTACRAIRAGAAGKRHKDVPVIAMTAHVLKEFEEKSRNAGMNAFLAKPADEQAVFQMIDRFRPGKTKGHPSDTPIWDREENLKSLGNNPDLMERIIRIFVSETEKHLRELNQSVESGNWDDCRRIAHTLKGSAGRIFAQSACEKATALEKVCRARDKEPLAEWVEKTCSEFEVLMEILKREIIHDTPS